MYTAIVKRLENVRPHSNADRLKIATVTGEQVVVSIDAKDGDLGVFFPIDGCILPVFLSNLNLYRHSILNEDKELSGMFDDNGRVRAQTFRGERSEGFWIPIENIISCKKFSNFALFLQENYEFNTLGEYIICEKYRAKSTLSARSNNNSVKKKTIPMFHEHFDTAQYGRSEHLINEIDQVIITEKLHGTSQRVGHVYVENSEKLSLWDSLCYFINTGSWETHVGSWKHVIGTRRVILGENKSKDDNGFYTLNFREKAAEPFMDKLHKGETVYYEVVGYEAENKPIMGIHSNEKLKKFLSKEEFSDFISKFGSNTCFNYGTNNGDFDILVYRITLTNEDGYTIDLNWDAIKNRCQELNVKHVPELFRGSRYMMAQLQISNTLTIPTIPNNNSIKELSNIFIKNISEGMSTIGNNIKEGVCIRVDNNSQPLILKEKNYIFKVLEGIIKDSNVIDTEELEG